MPNLSIFSVLAVTLVSNIIVQFAASTSGLEVGINPEDTNLSNRSKRDLDFQLTDNTVDKRPRQFVGKRGGDGAEGTHPEFPIPTPIFGSFLYDDDDYPSSFDNEEELRNMIESQYKDIPLDLKQMVDEFLATYSVADHPDTDASTEKEGTLDSLIAKRPRQFVGKRPRQFVGKRPRQFVGKRPRQFVGKRPRQFVGKRPRQFVGKRPRQFVGKRPRQFVGKRDWVEPYVLPSPEMSKRPRQFVGKRDALYDVFVKRPRQFVGKRESLEDLFQQDKRPRQFVGKRPRQFVGKRESSLIFAKRPRQFVGKRSFEDVSAFSKRPRQFVGKRSDEAEISKRPRQFVGKRSEKDDTFFQNSIPLGEELFSS